MKLPYPTVEGVMCTAPVIPVLVIERVEDAVALAEALVAGGINVLEVTLRTPAALMAIEAMAQVSGAIVGAGTVLNEIQLEQVQRAGARFAVSPGLTPSLARAAHSSGMPLLPGAITSTEIMAARDLGFFHLKFFPAEPAGGLAMLKSFGSVFRDVVFCPTGGITEQSAQAYLALNNVACVGGSWLAPAALMNPQGWSRITDLARAALALRA